MIRREELSAYQWLSIPVWTFDKALLQITWGNPAALTFWGADSVESLRLRDFADTTGVAQARLEKVHAAAAQGHHLEEQWTLYPLGSPKQIVLQSNVLVGPDGQPGEILFIANNLKSLPDSQLRGMQVLSYSPELVAVYTLDGATLYRNPAAAQAWDGLIDADLVPEEALSSTFRDAHIPQLVAQHIRDREVFGGEFEMRTTIGMRTFALDCRGMTDPVNGTTSIGVSARDITEYKAVERERDQLREAQVRAERAKLRDARAEALIEKRNSVTARRLFMATASHELRTPLQTIIGCVDLLEHDPSEVDHCLPELRDAAEQMSAIAGDLVEFVRADNAPGIHLSDVDGADFLERVLSSARKDAATKGLKFESDVSSIGAIRIDDKRVRQVVSNLALNAVKYTPKGSVRVHAALSASAEGPTSLLKIVISDTGVGMPDGSAKKVLQPFVRGPGSERIDPQGLGMGLAIVQSHLTEMRGLLDIVSSPGRGTTVTAVVPCLPVGVRRALPPGGPDAREAVPRGS